MWLLGILAGIAVFVVIGIGAVYSPAGRQLEGGPIGEDGLTNKERGELAGLDNLAALGRPLSPAQERKRAGLRWQRNHK